MFDFNKKKISLSILLITLVLISFISKVKIQVEIPVEFEDTTNVMDVVDLFGCTFNYINTLFFLLLFIIMSILLFIFSDDVQISKKGKSLKEKVLKWDIKLMAISILVLIIILIIGKSCNNNSKSNNSRAMQDTLAVPDEIAVDSVAAAPIEETYHSEDTYDDYKYDSMNNAKKDNNKGMSAFSRIKKEQAQGDQAINSNTGEGLSFEELRSAGGEENKTTTATLSKYKSKGEKDK